MVAEVYYWRYEGLNSVGHLSLRLADGTYISHWPQKTLDKSNVLLGASSCQMPNLLSDIFNERRVPDDVISLPDGMVDENEIKSWWINLVLSDPNYHLLFINCAQLVRDALIVGRIRDPVCQWTKRAHFELTPYGMFRWIKCCISFDYFLKNRCDIRNMLKYLLAAYTLPALKLALIITVAVGLYSVS